MSLLAKTDSRGSAAVAKVMPYGMENSPDQAISQLVWVAQLAPQNEISTQVTEPHIAIRSSMTLGETSPHHQPHRSGSIILHAVCVGAFDCRD